MDINEELNKRKQEAEGIAKGYGEQATSLTGRLNEYEEFMQGRAVKELFDRERPKGYRPSSALGAWTQLLGGRGAMRGELDSALSNQRAASNDATDMLLELYNISQSGNTQAPSPSELLNAKMNGYEWDSEKNDWVLSGDLATDEQKFQIKYEKLDNNQKTTIDGRTTAAKEQADLINRIKGQGGGSFLSDMFTSTSGPLAGRTSWAGNPEQEQIRSDLGSLKDKIKKDLFGTAFTENEKKDAELMDPKRQEKKNIQNLTSLYKRNIEELKTTMRNAGYSNEEIASYMQKNGLKDPEFVDVSGLLGQEQTVSSSAQLNPEFVIEEVQ